MSMIDLLLAKKRDKEQEISIYFFEYCNLRCSFCWQDHNSPVGLDTIREKVVAIETYFKTEPKDEITFAMMGGEVFADNIFDRAVLEDFKFVTHSIMELGKKYNKKVHINWVTNLVTTKLGMIRELLEYGRSLNITTGLYTSYDFRGRFNINQFLSFKTNVDLIWDELKGFSLTLTKSNCQYFLTKTDPYFEYLYNRGAYIYFDYYMPDETADLQCPSDAMLYEVFKKVITTYPKIDPIRSWIKNTYNTASCRSSKMINPDNSMSNCGAMVIAQNEQATHKIYEIKLHNKSNTGIENHFLEKYGCLTCAYLDRCSFGCFMQHASTRFTEELDDCVYRKTFKFIDEQ
jgi:radical SAM protein with 4Fe4S-binding SPASM domain